jgi:chromosome segregation ATPase
MTVSEARIELSNLQDQHVDLQRRLEQLIESGDNPDSIMILQKAITQNAVRQYAAKSKIIRLIKQSHQDDREEAFAVKDALEKQLERSAQEYWDSLAVCEEKRVAYQIIQLKLGSNDSRLENDRQGINERQQELATHIARWKTDALLPAHEQACDL